MLTREDRARLLRETVLKSSTIDTHPTVDDPSDLKVPHTRRGLDAALSEVQGLKASRHGNESPEIPRQASPTRNMASSPLPTLHRSQSRDRLYDLETKVRRLETENQALTDRIDHLQRDNLHLTEENATLKSTQEATLKQNSELVDKFGKAMGDWAQITPEEWNEANERVNILIRENDLLMDQRKATQIEIEQLQDGLARQGKQLRTTTEDLTQSQEQLHALQQELLQTNDRKSGIERELKACMEELTSANVENDHLHGEIRRYGMDIRGYQGKIGDLKRSLEEVTNRYQTHVRESQALAARERELLDNVKTTELERDDPLDWKTKYASLNSDHQSLRSSYDELLQISRGLEKRVAQLEDQEANAHMEVQKQIEKAEDAKLEFDKALIREQQCQTEIQRLNERLLELPQKYRERADQEVATMRAQFLSEKRQLNIEITALETKCAQLQHQSERSIRDKRSAEAELEKLTRHLPEESERLELIIEELNNKLRASERERNQATHKFESLHSKLLREESRFEKEKQLIAERSDDAFRRLRSIERDLEETKEDRVKLFTKLTDLEHTHKKLAEAKQKAAMQHEAETAAVTQKYEEQIKDLTFKLESVTESHTRTCRDIQTLLSDQKRMTEKWHNESQTQKHHHAQTLRTLQAQLSDYQTHVNDLEGRIQTLDTRLKETVQKLSDERCISARLSARVRDAEGRCEGLRKQVVAWGKREEEWAEERKRLQRDLDRVKLEQDRKERERVHQFRRDDTRYPGMLRTPPLDDENQMIDDTSREVLELKAEIDRVKQRSRRCPGFERMLLDMDSDGDDEEEEEE
ncbi:hypothetical protein SpCBS45565_g00725 [Spizellomyces sp. 'palustris']|nr:hypothetical protein SpCBS45565_g00725 [Spizellomyces sp. 'palustris']